jgi:AcrR family transcriptional regulator
VARLSRDLIIDAALALVDEEGLDALTARRLATRLGTKGASLYYYVTDMEDLLSEVAWRVVEPIANTALGGETWTEYAIVYNRTFRNALLQHPNVVPVLAGPLGKRVLTHRLYTGVAETMDNFLQLLAADGIEGEQALGVIEALSAFAFGAATVATPPPASAVDDGPPAVGPRFASVLANANPDQGDRFEFGIRSLVVGMAAELAKAGTPR